MVWSPADGSDGFVSARVIRFFDKSLIISSFRSRNAKQIRVVLSALAVRMPAPSVLKAAC
jgi:hypothetical protein